MAGLHFGMVIARIVSKLLFDVPFNEKTGVQVLPISPELGIAQDYTNVKKFMRAVAAK